MLKTSANHVSCELAGETVILDLASGKYYGLDAVASSVWDYLQAPHGVDELVSHLLETFDVSPDQCRNEVSAHLSEMQRLGLIETAH